MTTLLHRTGVRRSLFTLCVLAAFGSACASTPDAPTNPELANAPSWVTRGCPGSENRICGVGSASGMQNSALRRTAAIGRARTDIARSLQVRVAALLKDYASTTVGGETLGRTADEAQHIVDVSKQITNMTLAGTEVMDTWISESSTLYALVTLEVDKFTHTVGRMNQLSENLRSAVIERADDAFAELDVSR